MNLNHLLQFELTDKNLNKLKSLFGQVDKIIVQISNPSASHFNIIALREMALKRNR